MVVGSLLVGAVGFLVRPVVTIVALAAALAVTNCAQIVGQLDAQSAAKNAKSCFQQIWATPQGQLLSPRLWRFNETDTASKLSDPNPLTKSEQDALVVVHTQMQSCKEIILTHDNIFAAWETPYWQEYFQRNDELFYKLASGEIPVGLANKLSIESNGKFQTDVSSGHAQAVAVDEARQQRASEAMMQAGAQVLAAQAQSRPRMTTTNCSWMGNSLNCTSMQ
jgi:hypothetical protein